MAVHFSRRTLVSGAVSLALLSSSGLTLAQDATKRGGLGLTGAEWKELWGKPDAEITGKYWKFEYMRFGITVRLIYLEDDQHIIGFDVEPVGPISSGQMTSFTESIERFYPEDAVKIDEYPRPAGPGTVAVYNSPWLAERFLALNDPVISDWFTGGNPGDFIAIYRENSAGLVESVTIGLGNNP